MPLLTSHLPDPDQAGKALCGRRIEPDHDQLVDNLRSTDPGRCPECLKATNQSLSDSPQASAFLA